MSNVRKIQKFVSPKNSAGPSSNTGPRLKRDHLNETVGASMTFRRPTPGSKKSGEIDVNASICVSSVSSRTRKNLNETHYGQSMPSIMRKPALLSKKAIEDEHAKLQLTFAQNEYLQSLMKQMIIEEKIKKNTEILVGQLSYYGSLLDQKQEQLDKIVDDTKFLEKQKQVIETLNQFEEALDQVKRLFKGHNIEGHLEKLKEILELESQKLYLKNVKPLKTQEDYDRFMDSMNILLSTMEKFMNSGRDFDMVHTYAEEIRSFVQSREEAHSARAEALQVEKDAITGLIANLSQLFSKKYEMKGYESDDTI